MNLALSSAASNAACAGWRQSPAVHLECTPNAAALGSRPLFGLITMSASFSPRPAQSLFSGGALQPQSAIATHDLTPPMVASGDLGHLEIDGDLELSELTAVSPLNGRYGSRLKQFQAIFSGFGLIRYRVLVEVLSKLRNTSHVVCKHENVKSIVMHLVAYGSRYGGFRCCPNLEGVEEVPSFSEGAKAVLENTLSSFGVADALMVKKIERTSNHDVRAIEHVLKDKFRSNPELSKVLEFVHFACTSEDINNLTHALMLRSAVQSVVLPAMNATIEAVRSLAHEFADVPMLSRTHGQPASPTTLGKEMANFCYRLQGQRDQVAAVPLFGKIAGAVGTYNAHMVAYFDIDWQTVAENFVTSLGITFNPYTTQKVIAGEFGSSTMPHKVNPIDFENSEGNLGLANAYMSYLSSKLRISRWKRDSTDSTVLRNLGLGLGHSLLAYESTIRGIKKLQLVIKEFKHWRGVVLQVMRRYGIKEPYEKLKAVTRDRKVSKEILQQLVDALDIPD